MNVIVDTHAEIWLITDNQQLSKHIKNLIEAPQNNCYISIATLWEMAI